MAPETTTKLPAGVQVRPSVDKPNVVVVMTDDQTVEQLRHMPITRRLIVEQGTTFDNSIVTYPTCCPSRAAFFSGQYNHNNGVQWNSGKTGGFASFTHQETAYPAALQKAGYRTAHIGKFLNGYGDANPTQVPPGWDYWAGLVGLSTGQYFRFTLNIQGTLKTFEPNQYQTDVLTDLAVQQVNESVAAHKPFLLSVAYLAPHAEFGCPLGTCDFDSVKADIENANQGKDLKSPVPAPADKGTAAGITVPPKKSFNTIGVGMTAGALRQPFTTVDLAYIAKNYEAEVESLQSVDRGVGRIISALETTGQLDKTVIVFTSDNGYFHGEHRLLYGKYLPYEESLTVPLVIRGPGVAAGVTNHTVVSNIDLAPTFLQAAKATPLRTLDGRSLWPLLANPASLWDRPVFIEGLAPPIQLQPAWQGLRTRRFAYFEFTSGGINGVELYDLTVDPLQMNNLVLNEDYRDVVQEFHRMVMHLRSCVGAQCSQATSPAGFESGDAPGIGK